MDQIVSITWKPIGTAPKDGRRIILCGRGENSGEWYWSEAKWFKDDYSHKSCWINMQRYSINFVPEYWCALTSPQFPK